MNWWEGLFNVVVFQDANNTMLTPKKRPIYNILCLNKYS